MNTGWIMPPHYGVCHGFCSYHTLIFSWRRSIAKLCVHFIWWGLNLAIRLPLISDGTSKQAAKKKKRKSFIWWVREKKTGEMEQGGENIKMEIIHLSRSVWQLEPPFDNVMHKIMRERCEGHREMLKNICCYVSNFFVLKKTWSRCVPKQSLLAPVSLLWRAPLGHCILSSERLIQLASQ